MRRTHGLFFEADAEGYVDVAVLVLSLVLVLALSLRVLPVFIAKQQFDTFATELMREAEISGRIGAEMDRRAAALREKTGLDPQIAWSDSGQIQLNQEVTVTLTLQKDIGLLGNFGSFPSPCAPRPLGNPKCTGSEVAEWAKR